MEESGDQVMNASLQVVAVGPGDELQSLGVRGEDTRDQ